VSQKSSQSKEYRILAKSIEFRRRKAKKMSRSTRQSSSTLTVKRLSRHAHGLSAIDERVEFLALAKLVAGALTAVGGRATPRTDFLTLEEGLTVGSLGTCRTWLARDHRFKGKIDLHW